MSEAQPESTSAAMDERGAALPYCAGIDGLRALAVTAVLLYHAGLPLPGGFLGVEVFFVLSGYLITALLRAEWERAGSIRLGRFWARRARRLLPALALALGGTALLAGRLAPRESADLPGDMLAALGYVMNWRLVASAQSYFAPLARPPLLQHLWSLAVEEQFYLLWPLIFIGGMRLLRRRGLLGATLLAAAGSALLMAVLRRPGLDPARVYYGTDTRAAGLLLGAALALAWPPGRQPAAELRLAGWLADGLGLAGLLALATCARLLYAGHPRLYPGGFATAAIGTAAIIAAVTHPRARVLPALLGGGIPRWIGMRSYGIYLWHWPIFMLTRPRLDVALDGWPLLALRLGAVVGLAAFSFRVVEQPLRRAASPPPRRDPARSLAWGVTLAGIAAIAAGPLMLAAPRAIRAGGSPVGPPPAACPPGTGAAGCAAARPAAASGGPTPSPRPAPLSAGIAAQPPMDLPAELQAILDATVADTYVPGAVMAVSIPGQAPWVGAAGVYDWETKTPMRPDTPVFIGSVSKMFTAVISLQLWEEGRISLDAPVERWLPGLLPDGGRITVRHLLQHTSGLYDYLEDPGFLGAAYADIGATWSPRAIVAYAADFPLAFEPGEAGGWAYSSTNYVVLGMLIEAATGHSLAQETRQRILEPLGMDHTFVLPAESPGEQLPQGYVNTTRIAQAPATFVFGTAHIVSTAADLQRFAAALFAGSLLREATLAEMQSMVDGYEAFDVPALEYGLGLMRGRLRVGADGSDAVRDPALRTVIGHMGGFAGFRSAVWYAPESGVLITLGLTQADIDPNAVAASALDAVLRSQGR